MVELWGDIISFPFVKGGPGCPMLQEIALNHLSSAFRTPPVLIKARYTKEHSTAAQGSQTTVLQGRDPAQLGDSPVQTCAKHAN